MYITSYHILQNISEENISEIILPMNSEGKALVNLILVPQYIDDF